MQGYLVPQIDTQLEPPKYRVKRVTCANVSAASSTFACDTRVAHIDSLSVISYEASFMYLFLLVLCPCMLCVTSLGALHLHRQWRLLANTLHGTHTGDPTDFLTRIISLFVTCHNEAC